MSYKLSPKELHHLSKLISSHNTMMNDFAKVYAHKSTVALIKHDKMNEQDQDILQSLLLSAVFSAINSRTCDF